MRLTNLFKQPKVIQIIREDDSDIRVSSSDHYDKYRVKLDPNDDFSKGAKFSQLDIDEMTKRQYFNPGTILTNIETERDFIITNNTINKRAKNGTTINKCQEIIPYEE